MEDSIYAQAMLIYEANRSSSTSKPNANETNIKTTSLQEHKIVKEINITEQNYTEENDQKKSEPHQTVEGQVEMKRYNYDRNRDEGERTTNHYRLSDWTNDMIQDIMDSSRKTERQDLEELSDLRAHIRYRTLVSELENSSEDLQKLRPMQGENLLDDNGVGYVKDGRNPEKTYLQVHYLKGYFLLKYMSKIIGRDTFDGMIKDYVMFYHGQLVLSKQILDFFISAYPKSSEKGMTCDVFYEDWLNHPGLNPYVTRMYGNISNQLVSVVKRHFDFWLKMDKMSRQKSKATKKMKIDLEELLYPDQSVLLLEYILELPNFSLKALREVYQHYDIASGNADIRHRWCELVILNNYPDLSEVKRFLVEDQAMGVYLYGELVISGKKKHRKLALEVYGKVKEEMDENARLTVSAMLYGE